MGRFCRSISRLWKDIQRRFIKLDHLVAFIQLLVAAFSRKNTVSWLLSILRSAFLLFSTGNACNHGMITNVGIMWFMIGAALRSLLVGFACVCVGFPPPTAAISAQEQIYRNQLQIRSRVLRSGSFSAVAWSWKSLIFKLLTRAPFSFGLKNGAHHNSLYIYI